ncbi:gamma-glutamyltransferase family protein [Ferruginivarius sediminum]|uniref:gamma-glutamyltransferase family protein n=1 Tax=Ferruginivarius sediminum TaxID=2661937 RepID=UPI0026AA9172
MTFTTRPELRGTHGAVASTHWLASAAGMAILEKGGNAFDAAVATGFVLQVVEPHLNGPGGEVPILLHDRRRDGPEVICGQGTAPRAATIARFRSLGLDMVPGTGLLASVVPGAFDAWMLLLRDHGTLRLRDVMEPAVHYAEYGFPVVPRISQTIRTVAKMLREEWPTSAAVYLPGDTVPAPGTLFRNPRLAETYRRIVDEAERRGGGREGQIQEARKSWYEGFVAETIGRFCRSREVMDVSGRRHGGLLSEDDLANWNATKEKPVTYDYAGYTVCKGGPWSQGPVFLQQLALLDGFDLDAMDPNGPDFVHTVVECAKLAFADREAFYGDPDFADVPMETLLSADYAASRRALAGEQASRELRPGTVEGYGGALDRVLRTRAEHGEAFDALGGGEPTVQDAEPGDTCHLDIVDRHGNMVSATPSGGWLQSSPVIPELGFCLNTRAQMFWLDEDMPSALQPGKRPRTTLSANLALKDGAPVLAWGTPGGDYQDQWSLTFFLRHVHHGLNLQESIDAPMFQIDHMPASFFPRLADPGSLTLEDRFSEETIAELRRRGHEVEVADGWSLGRLSAVGREADGQVKAAANPRFMQGYAVAR